MSFLLDTNVVSEPRKGRRADANVMRWFSSAGTGELYISVLVIGEIRQGIEGLRRRDPLQASHLEFWLLGLRRGYADRILPVARTGARLLNSFDSSVEASRTCSPLKVLEKTVKMLRIACSQAYEVIADGNTR